MSLRVRRRSQRYRAAAASGGGGGTDYAAAVLAHSPSGYWHLDETTGTFADSSGNGYTGTAEGTVTRGIASLKAALGGAIRIQGAGSIGLATLGSFGSAMYAGCTFEFIIRTTTTAQGCVLGAINTGSTTGIQLVLNKAADDTNATGSVGLWVRGENGAIRQIAFLSADVFSGTWAHVAITWAGAATATPTVYVNGQSVAVTDSMRFYPMSTTANLGYPLTLCSRNSRGTLDTRATADLDEVAVYPRQLTAAQVATHYSALTAA